MILIKFNFFIKQIFRLSDCQIQKIQKLILILCRLQKRKFKNIYSCRSRRAAEDEGEKSIAYCGNATFIYIADAVDKPQ